MTATTDREPAAATAVAQESILDEIDRFVARYVNCTDEQRWAMILYAGASHVISECATFPRMLFARETEKSGKTVAMDVTAALCSRTIDAAGTSFDLVAALAEASLEPEKAVPTIVRDEIGEAFPNGGGSSGNNVVGDILRRGYKRGKTRGRASGGKSQRYSIFTPFLMTGLRTSIPRDIRTRTIVITMVRGKPLEYFDVRDAETDAYTYGRVLARAITQKAQQVNEFRVLRLGIPGLTDRYAEIWEPLFAVALLLGGSRWLGRAKASFRSLSLAQMDAPELTPGQKLLRAVTEIAPRITIDGFVPGSPLADELRRTPDYEGRSLASAAKLISNVMPVNTVVRRLSSGDQMRGYNLRDILEAWDRLRPPTLDEMEEPEEVNPFDVLDGDEDSLDDEDVPDDLLEEAEALDAVSGADNRVAGVAGRFARPATHAAAPGGPGLPTAPLAGSREHGGRLEGDAE